MQKYVAEWSIQNYVVAKDTRIDITFSVLLNNVAYDLTGKALSAVVADNRGQTIRTWLSTGTSPAITISTSTFNIYDNTGLSEKIRYTVYILNVTDNEPIGEIALIVSEFKKT